ncbi:Gfo/Idh/MocA family oxidoreductase [Arthrobacter sp. 260]|uniref:Gfo/Idh/MocA family protein n=1 Tax=Arthrobacter sp. 260 TaxID=2735314 RepID=UPI0014930965|nr:Gfo/Idh/MocA family oxidoreductase [Arthrobacter sp. 260]NOJ58898.1 Gfo/Idh/MocA family oxidoreductase [Arthrobacter sp. 260]
MTPVPDYRPQFPTGTKPAIGILGCGAIAQTAHLPAYQKYDLDLAGVWSRTPATTEGITDRFPSVRRVYATPEELLEDPDVGIVDLATPAADRLVWLKAAVTAGKHVLAQKPLTTDLEALAPILADAAERGVLIAVNQNARWAPAWRLATLLVEDGAIGEVVGVTHLHDKPLPPIVGTPFDDLPHMLITDYLMHWIDITRCWLGGKSLAWVQATDARLPGQPAAAKNQWSASIQVACADGAQALLRVVGDVKTRKPSCPFWIHGTAGTLRGSVLGGSDRLELERDDVVTQYALDGEWFVDGFAGAMGELMCAIAEDRQPFNSAAHNVASLALMLAARTSADDPAGARQPLSLRL